MYTYMTAVCIGLTFLLPVNSSFADVIEYEEKDEWEAAVGPFTTIDFTGYPQGTIITDQYAYLGIMFTDGNDAIDLCSAFPNDGAGLHGNWDDAIHMSFDMPLFYIAAEFPGHIQFDLFSGGELIYTSSWIGGSGVGFFGGLVSTESFDAAIIFDPVGSVCIDDLHFGPPIPAPPVLALLAIGCFTFRRRRRR